MFVRLDDGPRPFDDILQAQRAGMVQQQQGFENALAAEQFKVRRDQGAESLRIAEGRNNLLRRDTAGRTISRALDTAAKFGRPMTPSRQSFETMFAELAKSNPEAAQELMAKYGAVEFDDDPTGDPVFAQMFEDTSGLWLAEEGKRSVAAAERALMGAQALMADPRAGIGGKDLEPFMKLVDEGTAPAEEIEARFQAIRSKAAKNIGFAEMKTGVMAEVVQSWGTAMAQINAGASKSLALPGEKSDAEALADLRGAIETATTPEELHRARGQFLVKAHGLDGVISEAETAAFEAGRVAAESMYQQKYGEMMGGQGQRSGAAPAQQSTVPAQGGAQVDAKKFPNLMKAAEKAAPVDASNAPLTPSDAPNSLGALSAKDLKPIHELVLRSMRKSGALAGDPESTSRLLSDLARALVEDHGFANDEALYEFLAQAETRYHDWRGKTANAKESGGDVMTRGRKELGAAGRASIKKALIGALDSVFGAPDVRANVQSRTRGIR